MHLIQIASVCIDADGHASMPNIHNGHVYRYMRWMHRCILKQFLKNLNFRMYGSMHASFVSMHTDAELAFNEF